MPDSRPESRLFRPSPSANCHFTHPTSNIRSTCSHEAFTLLTTMAPMAISSLPLCPTFLDFTNRPFASVPLPSTAVSKSVAQPNLVVEATAVSVINENAVIGEPAPPELLLPCPKPASSFVACLQQASRDNSGDDSGIPASDGSYIMVVFPGAIPLFETLNAVINKHTPRRGNWRRFVRSRKTRLLSRVEKKLILRSVRESHGNNVPKKLTGVKAHASFWISLRSKTSPEVTEASCLPNTF